jgi:hypothetical protein
VLSDLCLDDVYLVSYNEIPLQHKGHLSGNHLRQDFELKEKGKENYSNMRNEIGIIVKRNDQKK